MVFPPFLSFLRAPCVLCERCSWVDGGGRRGLSQRSPRSQRREGQGGRKWECPLLFTNTDTVAATGTAAVTVTGTDAGTEAVTDTDTEPGQRAPLSSRQSDTHPCHPDRASGASERRDLPRPCRVSGAGRRRLRSGDPSTSRPPAAPLGMTGRRAMAAPLGMTGGWEGGFPTFSVFSSRPLRALRESSPGGRGRGKRPLAGNAGSAEEEGRDTTCARLPGRVRARVRCPWRCSGSVPVSASVAVPGAASVSVTASVAVSVPVSVAVAVRKTGCPPPPAPSGAPETCSSAGGTAGDHTPPTRRFSAPGRAPPPPRPPRPRPRGRRAGCGPAFAPPRGRT